MIAALTFYRSMGGEPGPVMAQYSLVSGQVTEVALDFLPEAFRVYFEAPEPAPAGLVLSEYEEELIRRLRKGTDNEEEPEYDDRT